MISGFETLALYTQQQAVNAVSTRAAGIVARPRSARVRAIRRASAW